MGPSYLSVLTRIPDFLKEAEFYWTRGDLSPPATLYCTAIIDRRGLRIVIPHWNNAEGGTHGTRFCFMGENHAFKLMVEHWADAVLKKTNLNYY